MSDTSPAQSKTHWSALALIVANLYPLAMTLLGRIELGDLLVFYWMENVVIGLLTIVKLATVRRPKGIAGLMVLPLLPFFTFHYGMFCFVHGIFVMVMAKGIFAGSESSAEPSIEAALEYFRSGWLWLALLFASHGLSLLRNWFIGGERLKSDPQAEMARPYSRIVLLHITIIAGAFLAIGFNALLGLSSTLGPACILIIGKIALDLRAHGIAHDPDARAKSEQQSDERISKIENWRESIASAKAALAAAKQAKADRANGIVRGPKPPAKHLRK